MPKKLNGLSDWVLSHWFSTGKSSQRKCGQEDWTVKETWEERGPVE